jgi:hypothetical protein
MSAGAMQLVHRALAYGPWQDATSAVDLAAAPYALTNRHGYLLGHVDGVTRPIGDAHLPGRMGGWWVHPYRVADAPGIGVCDADGAPVPLTAVRVEEALALVRWRGHCGRLDFERSDALAPTAATWLSQVRLHNADAQPWHGAIDLHCRIAFEGAWFSGLQPSAPELQHHDGVAVVCDASAPRRGVALGADHPGTLAHAAGPELTLRCAITVPPGATMTLAFALAATTDGAAAAVAALRQALADPAGILAARTAEYAGCHDSGLRVAAPAALARDVALARANLLHLGADYPDLGAYLLAGLPEYPQLFGCDTTYSVVGAVVGGAAAMMRSALERLGDDAGRACGRVPHELTTNGRVFHGGNIQETPQFTIAVWDYLRWTGDLALARRLFPVCREGMCAMLAAWSDPSGYPHGDGMVERLGMGTRKLDSACYAVAGYAALAGLAAALGEPAAGYRATAERMRAAFDRDWWLDDEACYGDSMQLDGRVTLAGHWTVVLPLQLGLAPAEHAARALARIERDWLVPAGLVHTRMTDEQVWTLPTGLLALAAFRHGRAALGLQLLQAIASTTRHGAPGMFKELIPEGLCFVQLWSAALYLQGVVEGMLGLSPAAHRGRIVVQPALPPQLTALAVRGVPIAAQTLDIDVSRESITISHVAGVQPLELETDAGSMLLAPGSRVVLARTPHGQAG